MVDSISARGLQGIMAGLQQAAKSAEQVASGFESGSDSDVVEGIIGLSQGKRQVAASTKIIKTDQELNDAVLDILA